ncbi:MAG: T9SS type A sorting domain-containing protein [Fibrobacteres bacterium]|nr:T9SS type A sorting domain-containing protein [Fibrobacterota bacterium]
MNSASVIFALLLVFLMPAKSVSFTDITYYNSAISQNNYFRVFTPNTYNPSDTAKKYPVIYFLHGCRGTHRLGDSDIRSYSSIGLSTPALINSSWGSSSEYSVPYNPDFENFSDTAGVIIIACNGNFAGGGCAAWTYSPATTPNLASFMKVLIDTVDKRYNTVASRAGRAITGISLGGYAACFIAGNIPEYFSSASQFCRSPGPFIFALSGGNPTNVDANDYWRNYRYLPFRTSTNRWDYLQYYTREMYYLILGGVPDVKMDYTTGIRHFAGNLNAQLQYHRQYFQSGPLEIKSPSHINTYSSFTFNGYSVTSNKRDSGYIYLKDITANGFGIYTRRVLPFNTPFDSARITVTTGAVYSPTTSYSINRYDYGKDSITSLSAQSDAAGKLALTVTDPKGSEIGINGSNLQAPVNMLINKTNETYFVPTDKDTFLSVYVVNLSNSNTTVTFSVTTENTNLFTILDSAATVTIPAKTKLKIDTLVALRASLLAFPLNNGFLKVKQTINGTVQIKEHLLQVKVINAHQELLPTYYTILDGRTENFFSVPFTEGTGNGDGAADSGEVICVGINPPEAASRSDNVGFRPAVPCISMDNPDFELVGVKTFTRENRFYHSVLLKAKRSFSLTKPAFVRFQSKIQWNETNNGGVDNKALQNYKETFHIVPFPKGASAVEHVESNRDQPLVTVRPNPSSKYISVSINEKMIKEKYSLAVYNMTGQKVADLRSGVKNGSVLWNGTATPGEKVPAGVYLIKLSSNSLKMCQKVIFSR